MRRFPLTILLTGALLLTGSFTNKVFAYQSRFLQVYGSRVGLTSVNEDYCYNGLNEIVLNTGDFVATILDVCFGSYDDMQKVENGQDPDIMGVRVKFDYYDSYFPEADIYADGMTYVELWIIHGNTYLFADYKDPEDPDFNPYINIWTGEGKNYHMRYDSAMWQLDPFLTHFYQVDGNVLFTDADSNLTVTIPVSQYPEVLLLMLIYPFM